MKLETNGDYNPVQLNESVNYSPDGTILSKSVMINIRNESPKEVWKLYRELNKLIDEGKDISEEPKKTRGKKKSKEKNQEPEARKETVERICPKCGSGLLEKRGISKNGRPYAFMGCSAFPNCRHTEPILTDKEKEKLIHQPCDEDIRADFAPIESQ